MSDLEETCRWCGEVHDEALTFCCVCGAETGPPTSGRHLYRCEIVEQARADRAWDGD